MIRIIIIIKFIYTKGEKTTYDENATRTIYKFENGMLCSAVLQDKTAKGVALFLYDLLCRYNYAYQSLVQSLIDV